MMFILNALSGGLKRRKERERGKERKRRDRERKRESSHSLQQLKNRPKLRIRIAFLPESGEKKIPYKIFLV